MAELLVTIITPTYNRAKFLPETVRSVLEQSYSNIEYIILDDGSGDHTEVVLRPFGDRLQYFYHANMGETATVNKGFSLARGDIVCVVNSDDPLYSQDAVRIAVEYLQNDPDALMAYPDWAKIDENGKVLHEERLPQYTLENMIQGAGVRLGPAMFIRKSTIDRIGPRSVNAKYTGDLDYSFRMAAHGKIIHIPHVLATHRVHSESLSHMARGERMASEVAALGENYINHPSLPNSVQERRGKIMAKWYLVSMSFIERTNMSGRIVYLKKALSCSVPATFSMVACSLCSKAKRCFSSSRR